MKQLFPRGKRIRPTDKDLVFHTALPMWSTPCSMIPLPTVFPLRMYRQRTAGSGSWKMSGGNMTSSPICSLPEEPAAERLISS